MKTQISILLFFLLLLGCSKTDEVPIEEQDFSFSALVGNEKFKAQGFGSIIAEYKRLENGLYQFAVVASTQPNESKESKRILIRAILPGPNFLNEDLGVVDNDTGSFSNPFAFYEEFESGTNLTLDYADTDITRVSSFRISDIDVSSKTISGNFRFTAASTIFNKVYEVKEGVFNNVTYKDLTNN